jgi:NAD(P)-dependent dehydrogenase (short-subunit alcohol dehydrogenase family)
MIDASLITGGGRGIGRAITLRLARENPVLVVGRNAGDLAAVCAEVRATGGTALACAGDVSDPATAGRAVQAAAEQGWFVRALVCNAGIGQGGPTATFDREVWRRTFEVNVHGSFYFVQACLPAMLERGTGVVCLVSSLAGVRGMKRLAAYSASKHALVGLARSLAQEYGKQGIVVVPVCPGFVESDMTRRTVRILMEQRSISEAEAEQVVAGVNPQRRILPPEEVAEAVALVCSGRVPALSGNPLVLSGGE